MVKFTNEDANDIANIIAGELITQVYKNDGGVSEVMTTLNMVQALVVKNCLNMIGDSMNMARADTMLDMAAMNSKEIIRTLTARTSN